MSLNTEDVWLGKTTLTRLFFKSKISDKQFEFDEATCNVSRQKNIVETVVVGREGTVKEHISNGDYQIDISIGIMKNDKADEYPLEELRALVRMMDEPSAIEVGSEYLDVFKIKEIVVKSHSNPQETFSNRQPFTISAVSDKPYLMKLKDDE
jgi:Domain of unknown function (DUF6046)